MDSPPPIRMAPRLVVNEGPPLPQACGPQTGGAIVDGSAFAPASYYELLDLGGKPVGRFRTWRAILDQLVLWPRRTEFELQLWSACGKFDQLAGQWRIWRGLSGRYHAVPFGPGEVGL